MAVTQKVTLYNNKFTVPPVINAVQNDTDRQIVATLGDFTLASGMTAKLSFIRSDGTHYEATGTINTTNNTVTAELDQALTQVGICKAQIKVTETDGLGSTFTFIIKVQPDVAGISVEQDGWSAEEFNERLTTAEQDIEDLAEEVDTDYAKKDGSYDNLSAGTASGIIGKSGETDTVPYTYRAIPHDSTREVMRKLVGATVGWNQLVYNNQTVTLSMPNSRTINISTNSKPSVVDHVYLYSCIITEDTTVGGLNAQYSVKVSFGQGTGVKAKMSRCSSPLSYIYVYIGSGESSGVSLTYKDFNAIDLTAMLGTAIADYVYGLETATAGAGVAWLKSHFPKAFSTYQPYDAGSLKSVEGLVSHDTKDADENLIASYPLDPTQELRGIFKLDASNNLYADGDEWYADGRKNTRYGIVDLGTLTWAYNSSSLRFTSDSIRTQVKSYPQQNNYDIMCSQYPSGEQTDKHIWIGLGGQLNVADSAYTTAVDFKAAVSGVYLVFPLVTPTESTAPSFADTQIVDPDGTEEFVTDCIVAVGNETFYADDLVGKLDDLPALPTTAGTYRLKVTVTAGVPSYEWVTT